MSQADQKLQYLLKEALPPVGDPALKRDLWPRMLRKLEEPARVPWFDWVLAALVPAYMAAFPNSILGLLYHL